MSVEIKTENALETFIGETRALFANEADLERRWTALTPILGRLLADREVIAAAKSWPDCIQKDGRAENLLFYEDREYGFAVNGLTKGEARQGSSPRLHDHGHIYTLYGVLDGHERVERYERIDDRSKPDYAEILKTIDVYVGPGEIDLVRPYEIHREVTVGERTVAIIIRSENGGAFNHGRYDPETNQYWESLGPRQTSCAMFPEKKNPEEEGKNFSNLGDGR